MISAPESVVVRSPRIGLSDGLVPSDPGAFDDATAARIAELGFTGVTLHAGNSPSEFGPERCAAIRAWAERNGLTIVQSWGFRANLSHPDNVLRAQHVALFDEAIRIAAELGAGGLVTGAGSADPRGGYTAHRDNHTDAAERRLVESLASLARTAEEFGVVIALESHCRTVLDSPARTKRVIETVGSPNVRANLDPVNFVDSLATLYRSTELIERVIDTLGGVAASGHVKDVAPGDGFVLQLNEVPLGEGLFDITRFVELFTTELPELFLIIEHLPADAVESAKAFLNGTIASLGTERRSNP